MELSVLVLMMLFLSGATPAFGAEGGEQVVSCAYMLLDQAHTPIHVLSDETATKADEIQYFLTANKDRLVIRTFPEARVTRLLALSAEGVVQVQDLDLRRRSETDLLPTTNLGRVDPARTAEIFDHAGRYAGQNDKQMAVLIPMIFDALEER